MYFDLEDIVLIIVKSLILTFIIAFLLVLGFVNYHVGVLICNSLNVPIDLALSVMSSGLAIDFTVVFYVIEMVIIYLLVSNLKKINIFRKFFNFIEIYL